MQADTAIVGGTLPLVLLPGTLCDARLFGPLCERLPKRDSQVREYIHVDLHGLSSTHALAERVLAAAPARFALLGFSLGAMVALEVAARTPERVAGLALVGGNGHAVPPDEQRTRRDAAAAVASPARHVGETLWDVSVADRKNEALRQLLMAMALACPAHALPTQVEVAVSRADSLPRLPMLTMPALVLAGADDAINPPAYQQRLASGLPDARLVLVPRAGHFVLLEQPDSCAAAVARWLAEVDSATTGGASPDDSRLKEIV